MHTSCLVACPPPLSWGGSTSLEGESARRRAMASDGGGGGASPARYGAATFGLSALMMLLVGVNMGKMLAGNGPSSERPTPTKVDVATVLAEAHASKTAGEDAAGAPAPPCDNAKDQGSEPAREETQSQTAGSAPTREPWAQLSERLLRPIRVHGPDGKLAQGWQQWFGDARESPPKGLTGRDLDRWRRFPGPPSDFFPKSRDVALKDSRGMVFGGGHGGLGNQLWAAAGVISVALVTNRLPVLACGSCYRHEALREIHCVPTKRGQIDIPPEYNRSGVGWGENIMAAPRDVAAYRYSTVKVLSVPGWLQSWQNFADHWETVCAALRPRPEVQARAQAFFDAILRRNNVTMTRHTRIVTMHVRRGDYIAGRGTKVHGAMTLEYYRKGLEMLRSKLLKLEPESAAEGMVVVIMTEAENVKWCQENMNWGESEGVKQTICATPEGSRCKGEIVDMLGLALGHFLIIANSSFSWWSQFFAHCMRELSGWWEVKSDVPTGRSAFEATVMPYRWYTGRLDRLRPKTYDFIRTDTLVPEPPELFEGQKELLEAKTKK